MNSMRGFLVIVFVLGSRLFSNNTAEYNMAIQYLEERGEVCFTTYVSSLTQLQKLSDIVSVDKVNGSEVFAYANKDEFNEFLTLNNYYEIEVPPGLLTNVECSDYTDYLEKGLPTEWDKYPTYSAYLEIMNKFQTDYPDLCRVEEFGTSVNGKKLMVAIISDNIDTEEKEPKFFYQATIHGDETGPFIFMLNLIEHLLKNYGSDTQATKLVDNIEIWINPLANPDGTYRSGDNTVSGARRYNANGVDLNRDFPDVELSKDSCNRTRRILRQSETKATMDLGDENIFTMSGDFHAGAELVCYPWGMAYDNHADKEWFKYVGQEWADLAQVSAGGNGYFTDKGSGCLNCRSWYEVHGERINYAAYNQQCRDITIEVSHTKPLPESSLIDYWKYSKESIITYLEQVLYGVHGTVTDSADGKPIEDVKVFVENHDVDNSHIYTDKFGGYYRPIEQGTYSFTFSKDGYESKTVENVQATNKQTKIVDVQLWDGSTGVGISSKQAKPTVLIMPFGKGVKIQYKNVGNLNKAGIYTMNGSLVQQIPVKRIMVWDGKNSNGYAIGNGCYIAKLVADKEVVTKSFVFSR